MSIGGTLADARQQAGLTVAEVSTRTRIGQGLIRAIEHDEFGACGGDFYARGHIRAIATAVGADPRPLISEYDSDHPYGSPVTLEELLKRQPPRTPRGPRRRRGRPRWLVPAVYLFWLLLLLPGSPASTRNPPGTLERQADRLLGLIG